MMKKTFIARVASTLKKSQCFLFQRILNSWANDNMWNIKEYCTYIKSYNNPEKYVLLGDVKAKCNIEVIGKIDISIAGHRIKLINIFMLLH